MLHAGGPKLDRRLEIVIGAPSHAERSAGEPSETVAGPLVKQDPLIRSLDGDRITGAQRAPTCVAIGRRRRSIPTDRVFQRVRRVGI